MNKFNFKKLLIFFGMIAPGLIIYLFIITYPILYSIWLSLTNFNPNIGGIGKFVGFEHYKTMVMDPNFWIALKNNLIVVGVSVFGQIPIGFMMAYILFRKMIKAQRFFQSMIFLPMFLSTIVIGILWKRLFTADGAVSRLIQIITHNPDAQFTMMLDPNTVMIPIGFVIIWMYTGLYMMIFLANLQKIDEAMIESAQIDGATEVQVFTKIIVPLLSGTVLVSTILAISGSFKGFELIFGITTQGLIRNNAMVLPIFMYQTAFQDYSNPLRFAYGAAISNATVFISIIFIVISNFIHKKVKVNEE